MDTATAPSPSREVVVTADGSIDLHTAGRVDEALLLACAGAQALVVLDLTAVDFMDSSGLRPVLAARELMQRRGGQLVVRGASRRCRRLFVHTGLTDLLDDGPVTA